MVFYRQTEMNINITPKHVLEHVKIYTIYIQNNVDSHQRSIFILYYNPGSVIFG